MELLYVRKEALEDASLAAIFERSKFGIAMAAMIKMIATTISNSISEKPFCLLRIHGAPFSLRMKMVRTNAKLVFRSTEEHVPCQHRGARWPIEHNRPILRIMSKLRDLSLVFGKGEAGWRHARGLNFRQKLSFADARKWRF